VNLGPIDPDVCLDCGRHPSRCDCADELELPIADATWDALDDMTPALDPDVDRDLPDLGIGLDR
jgi:hypothetical protein